MALENEVKFLLPADFVDSVIFEDSYPSFREDPVLSVSTIYLDFEGAGLLHRDASLGVLAWPGKPDEVRLVFKETLDWSGPVRHSLEVAVDMSTSDLSAALGTQSDTLAVRRARLLGRASEEPTAQVVTSQVRQRRYRLLGDGHLLVTNRDKVRFVEPDRQSQLGCAEFLELETHFGDSLCAYALNDLAARYASLLNRAPLRVQKYAFGMSLRLAMGAV